MIGIACPRCRKVYYEFKTADDCNREEEGRLRREHDKTCKPLELAAQ